MIVRLLSLFAALGVVAFIVYGAIAHADVDMAGCMDGSARRRGRILQHYACSPRLLAGGPRSWFAFVWLWSFPAVAVTFSFVGWRRKRHDAFPLS